MAVDVTTPSRVEEASEPGTVGGVDAPRVVWLARIGVAFGVLEVYIFGRWIFSDQFVSTPSGPDHDPHMFWIRFWEVMSIVGSVLFLVWIVRKTMRERQLPVVGIVAMAWMLTAWQDPGVDALRPVFSYNSHFFNRGTWAHFIPGWQTAAGANPQPIWFWIAIYLCFVPLGMMFAGAVLERVRRAFPRINKAGIVLAAVVLFLVLDVVGEQVTLRQGLCQYMRVPHTLTLWPGTSYQFPMYEGFAWGAGLMVLSAVIYYLRDARGHMVTDLGIERVTRWRTATRVLALGAVFNIAMLVFNLGFNYVNQNADVTPEHVPSYFSNGFCGVGGNPACPGN